MNTTSQIKKNLISRIKESNDLNLINKIQSVLDSSENNLYEVSIEQRAAILIGRSEIINEEFFRNDDVILEMKQWLEKK